MTGYLIVKKMFHKQTKEWIIAAKYELFFFFSFTVDFFFIIFKYKLLLS